MTKEPLEKRRELLRKKVMPLLPDSIRYSETLEGSAAEIVEAVREPCLEGVVAKRRGSPYEPGKRSGPWQKMRINKVCELVIGCPYSKLHLPRKCQRFAIGGRNVVRKVRLVRAIDPVRARPRACDTAGEGRVEV